MKKIIKYNKFNSTPYETHTIVYSLIKKQNKVLDIGCATGYFARELLKKNCMIYGLEIDPEAARKAKKFCHKIFVGDIQTINRLKIPKNFFDTILLLDVLEHIKKPERALALFKSYLKNHGNIIISVPNIAHILIRFRLLFGKFDYQKKGIMDNEHIHFFTKKNFLKMIKHSGYKLKYLDYSSDFGQLPLGAKIFKRIPKKIQHKITEVFNTILAVQFIAVCQ